MSETSSETTNPEGQTTDGKDGGETSPTDKPLNLTQEEFNRQLNERVKRERAKYSDYNDLKAKASRFDELEEANKTEVQRVADRLKAAEEDAATARRDALRFRIASKFKIDDEDADLFLTGSDEESITKQAERLVAREATRRAEADAAEAEAKRRGNHVPSEGTSPAASNANDLAFARDFFGAGG